MKTALALVVAFAALAPTQAQIFRPEAFGGAALGAIAGAVIGHNDGRHGWEGAAYGAGAGFLLGSMIGNTQEHRAWRDSQVPVPYRVDYVSSGHRHSGYYGYGRSHIHGWHHPRHSVWIRPSYPRYAYYRHHHHHRPVHYYYRSRPDYRGTGMFLGGLAGAIIGHNDGRHGWEGAAYGAGLGYLLGSVAERNARRAETAAEREALARAAGESEASPAASSSQPQQVTIINNYYQAPSTVASANAMFGR